MQRIDYSNPSDLAFRIVYALLLAGFAGAATFLFSRGLPLFGGIAALVAASLVLSLIMSLRVPGLREVAMDRILATLKDQRVERVLEIGAGKGALTIHLVKNGIAAVGEDIDEPSVGQARINAILEQVNASFVLGRDHGFSLGDEAVDGLTSFQVLHVVDDLTALFAEARRVLEHDGRLVMVDFRPGLGTFGLMLFGMFGLLPAAKLDRALVEAGFVKVSVTPITAVHQLIVASKPEAQRSADGGVGLYDDDEATVVEGSQHAVMGGCFVNGVFVGNNTQLIGANLGAANLANLHLVGSDLREADLRVANLERANVSNTDLRNANLTSCRADRVKLTHADARNACFQGGSLRNALLEGADLRDANFNQVNFADANLRGARLEGASLQGASLQDCKIIGATYDARTVFPEGFAPDRHGLIRK